MDSHTMNASDNMHLVLYVGNNVGVDHLDTICNFFEKYNLAKVDKIIHVNDKYDNHAILYLQYWENNTTAMNMYERLVNHGVSNIVYDDPYYFTVKLYDETSGKCIMNEDREIDTTDYRDDYVKAENANDDDAVLDTTDYRDDYVKAENADDDGDDVDDDDAVLDTSDYRDDYIKDENTIDNSPFSSIRSYLEEIDEELDEIDEKVNSTSTTLKNHENKIDALTDTIADLFKTVKNNETKMVSLKRVTTQLKKTSSDVYKKHVKNARANNVWNRRLRPRYNTM